MPQETLQEELERLSQESELSAGLEAKEGGVIPLSSPPPVVTPDDVPTSQKMLAGFLTEDIVRQLAGAAEGAVIGGSIGSLGGPVGTGVGAAAGGIAGSQVLQSDDPRAQIGGLLGDLAIPNPAKKATRAARFGNALLRGGASGAGALALSGNEQAAGVEAGGSLAGSALGGLVRAPFTRGSARRARNITERGRAVPTSDVGEIADPRLRAAFEAEPDQALGLAREQGLDINLSNLEEVGNASTARRIAQVLGIVSGGAQRGLAEKAAARDKSLQAFIRTQTGEDVAAGATRQMRDALSTLDVDANGRVFRPAENTTEVIPAIELPGSRVSPGQTRLSWGTVRALKIPERTKILHAKTLGMLSPDEATAVRPLMNNPDLPIDSLVDRAVKESLAPGKKGIDFATGFNKLLNVAGRNNSGPARGAGGRFIKGSADNADTLISQYRSEVMQALVNRSQEGVQIAAKTGVTSGRALADTIDKMGVAKLEAVFGDTAPAVKLISRVFRDIDPAEFAKEATGEFASLRFLLTKLIFGAASGAATGMAFGDAAGFVAGAWMGIAASMTLPAFASAIIFNTKLSKELVEAATNKNGRGIRNATRSLISAAMVQGQPVRRGEDGVFMIGDGNTQGPQRPAGPPAPQQGPPNAERGLQKFLGF